jgi:mono/diheme cytochrome c family protein
MTPGSFAVKSRVVIAVLLLVCLAEGALLLLLDRRSTWVESVHENPVERGRQIAERTGCFACHGPGGDQPIANPGATHGAVPGWGGGTWMLWSDDASDLRAWIVDGHPPGRAPDPGALISMPAYGSLLSDAEVDDLLAYVLSVAQFGRPEDPLAGRGRDTAQRLGCFGCHGPEGRGQIANPRSFRGYVPPWDGPDYAELVRDDDEFEQWVRNGVCDRLDNVATRAIFDRQSIRMPAYGDHVTDEQIEALLAYVAWMRNNPRAPGAR